MNHNSLPQPQFELPTPQKPDQDHLAPLEGDQDLAKATEQRNIETPAAPAPVSPAQAAQSVASSDPLAAAQIVAQPQHDDPTAAVPVADLPADDGDLIEKAWVDKAKAIVDQTRSDPHRQNAEINKVKHDYIQKRYRKEVKLSDE